MSSYLDTNPAGALRFVTASDTADLPQVNGQFPRALLVGTAGSARIIDISRTDSGGTNLIPLQAGYNPIRAVRIFSTGLTAANIWALY